MKIAVCSSWVPMTGGGAQFLNESLVRELRLRGHEVEAVYLPFVETPAEQLPQMMSYRMMGIIDRADMVICTRAPAHVIRHPNKVVYFIHHLREYYDLWDTSYRPSGNAKQLESLRDSIRKMDTTCLMEASKLFANSSEVSSRLLRFNGLNAKVLYPPLHRETEYCSGEYGDEIICVGRVERHKRSHLLIEAMSKCSPEIKLRIIGEASDPNYALELDRLIASLGLNGRVSFENRWYSAEEKARCVSKALVIAYVPELEDSYGYASLEAAAAMRPVVTVTDSGGVCELVLDGENGLVALPEPQALANAFNRLHSDRALAARLGRQGAIRAEQVASSWDGFIGELLA